MATQRDLDFTYTLIDKLFRMSIGETASFSGAKYDGDFSLTLEQAQEKKHDFIWEQLRLKPGQRVLDMGRGWGSLLDHLRERGVPPGGAPLAGGQPAPGPPKCRAPHRADSHTIT